MTEKLVTRFAPSPTGYLHVGGARTALFSWLLARHHGGRMILRIEDTDLKRNTPTALQQVLADLRWLGIDWDEGPDVGGPHGPYLQSQRLEIYQQYTKKLLETGQAYYCFETTEELAERREAAVEEKRTFIYRRPAACPDEKDAAQARAEGRPVAVRFAMPQGQTIVVEDVVRGQVSFNAAEFGDFVIVKSDGFPTYHFACVVDDELMGVTHILRGQEHLMNTPGHIALQDALGFRRPTYAHMSVTVSEGGGKLSKREQGKVLREALKAGGEIDREALCAAGQLTAEELESFVAGESAPDAPQVQAMAKQLGMHLPEINVVDFLRSGYIPEAMMNFLALLGWSAASQQEIMTGEELIGAFDLGRLNKTNSLFDRQKLAAFNTEHLRLIDAERRLEHFRRYLEATASPLAGQDEALLGQMLGSCAGARTLADVESKCLFLVAEKVTFDPQAVKKVLAKAGVAEILEEVREVLAGLGAWSDEAIHGAIEAICTRRAAGMGKVAQPIRVAITGTTVSPGIVESLAMLGRERTLERIDGALAVIKQTGG